MGAPEFESGTPATMQTTLQTMHPIFKELLSGGTAGAFAKTAVAPLERVKIIIQTSGVLPAAATTGVHGSPAPSTATASTGNIKRVLRRIVWSEGVKGLWKGNGASVLRVIPYAALHFSAYERYRTFLIGLSDEGGGGRSSSILRHVGRTPVVDLIAGSMAGATAVVFTYPLDLLRTRLAWRTSGIEAPESATSSAATAKRGLQRSTMATMLGSLVKKEGVPGLYKGVGPTLLGIFPYAGLKFFVYQYMKSLYVRAEEAKAGPGETKIATHMKLVFGAWAGLVAQTITYPLDVVRRRMQVQDMALAASASSSSSGASSPPLIRSSWHGLRLIYATMGVRRGLYAGLSLNYLKVVPSTAIGFAVYDSAKEYLDHKTSI